MNAFNLDVMFETAKGAMVCGYWQALNQLPDDSVESQSTSPPYALLREKEYGNVKQSEYVDWFLQFVPACRRILKDTGSFVVNIGGAWNDRSATRSLYQSRLLLRICDDFKFHLAQDFYLVHSEQNYQHGIHEQTKNQSQGYHRADLVAAKNRERPKADITRVLFEYSGMAEKIVRRDLEVGLRVERAFPKRAQKRFSYGRNLDGRLPHNLLCISNNADAAYLEGPVWRLD